MKTILNHAFATSTPPNSETQARIQQLKLGVDWHADHFRVVRMSVWRQLIVAVEGQLAALTKQVEALAPKERPKGLGPLTLGMLSGHYDQQLATIEAERLKLTKASLSRDFTLLQTTPGIGDYLGVTILHEIGDIARFPTVKDFRSYGRLVKGTVASAGQIKGFRGAKLGNPCLRWVFGEAAVIAKRDPLVIGPLATAWKPRWAATSSRPTPSWRSSWPAAEPPSAAAGGASVPASGSAAGPP